MAPQRKVFSKSFDLDTMSVTISTPSRAETYTTEGMSPAILSTLILHGLTQKLADKCATSSGSLTENEKWDAMNTVYAVLHAGQWSIKSEGAGSLLFRALLELSPNADRVELRATVDKWTPAERRAVSANPKVAPIIRRLESERVSDVDSDELLDNLLG